MKKETGVLKKYIQIKENYQEIMICEAINIDPPIVKDAYRVRIMKNNRIGNRSKDSLIIIKFSRHMCWQPLRGTQEKKGPLRLNLVGFDSDTPFYINLTIKKDKMLS